VSGFALVCGQVLPGIAPDPASRGDLAALHALIIHGRTDETLPVDWAQRADELLHRLGIPHELHLHDAGHELTAPIEVDFREWFGASDRTWNRES
jgi:phospholipase/carboxylesterase